METTRNNTYTEADTGSDPNPEGLVHGYNCTLKKYSHYAQKGPEPNGLITLAYSGTGTGTETGMQHNRKQWGPSPFVM